MLRCNQIAAGIWCGLFWNLASDPSVILDDSQNQLEQRQSETNIWCYSLLFSSIIGSKERITTMHTSIAGEAETVGGAWRGWYKREWSRQRITTYSIEEITLAVSNKFYAKNPLEYIPIYRSMITRFARHLSLSLISSGIKTSQHKMSPRNVGTDYNNSIIVYKQRSSSQFQNTWRA